ncbi:MAG TPA: hypothetical protein VNN20_04460 [Thermodesulfobacteriota bacterium]|nr:hypothetical protein [Thermodesulfobacteriota bacterium]
METIYLLDKGMHGVLDVFGPTVEFLTPPSEADAVYCVMKGTVPPGVSVPIHSHPDDESFFILSGTTQILTQQGDGFEFGANQLWIDRVPGLSQAEIWLELITNDVSAASEHLKSAGVVRCDEIEPLPEGLHAF